MKISFDFDSSLSENKIQCIFSLIQTGGGSCCIITSRNKNESNFDLLGVAKQLNIPNENIHYTEGSFKWRKINELKIDVHIDDVPEECELIIKNTKCTAILIWDEVCATSIKSDQFGKGIY